MQAYRQSINFLTARTWHYPPAAAKTGEYALFAGGDRSRDRELFYATCHACHPNGNAGIAPPLTREKDPSYYARKIGEGRSGLFWPESTTTPMTGSPDSSCHSTVPTFSSIGTSAMSGVEFS